MYPQSNINVSGHDPEMLTIAHLTWNQELPPGTHELEVINRMRMKKKWEQVLPPMDTPANIKLRTAILTAIEVDEWAFREAVNILLKKCNDDRMLTLEMQDLVKMSFVTY